MVNKDYILRLAEKFGRALAIILHLREANKYEEALIYIDDLLLQMTGLPSSFINSVSEDMLLKTLSPLGVLNVDKCLWIAGLLKAEGDIYADKKDTTESYYRYLKSLNLFLTAILQESTMQDSEFSGEIEELLGQLAEYELPHETQVKVFAYYEYTGRYAEAENLLFELLETNSTDTDLLARGRAFYERLLKKSDADLIEGNFSHEEAIEGLRQLRHGE